MFRFWQTPARSNRLRLRALSPTEASAAGNAGSDRTADATHGGQDPGPRRSARLRWWQPLAWLAVPFAFYLIPAFLGYAWNARNPGTPSVPGLEGNVGRIPDVPISVETYGTGVVFVPFQARLRDYLHAGELPLWNPYQGLGEPFAAQGDGNPYFPFEIVRALLPYSLGNFVTFFEYYLAAVFLYLFLRGLGLSEYAAIFGGISYVLSGALSLHIARPNIADQLCMIPVLFWAAARAMRRGSAVRYVIFALVAGLHLLGGFVQIAMISALVLVAFCAAYAWTLTSGPRRWARATLTASVVFMLGNGLAAFYLLPQLEAARITFNKNNELLAFLPMPYANITAFFFPMLFGPFFQSWVPIGYPEGVDWNNLYAYAGIGLLLLPMVGWVATRQGNPSQRLFLGFFAVAAAVLLLRFVSFPLVSGIDVLPGLGRQSPKHSLGLAVFCLAVAAAVAVDHVHAAPRARARWPVALVLVGATSSALTVIGKGGGWAAANVSVAPLYVLTTLFVLVALLVALWSGRRWGRLSDDGAKILLIAAVGGELSVYIPLGNGSSDVLYARLGVFALILGSGLLWALSWRWAAGGTFAAALVGYSLVIVMPPVGLPRQFDMDVPPPFMRWLEATAGSAYRSFGIPPDFSSLGSVQDISTVGPLAPRDFERFVGLVSSPGVSSFYRSSSTFMLTTVPEEPYNLDHDYLAARPIFDWLGVRYLVLDRGYFHPGGRTDDQALLAAAPATRVVYEDSAVRVLESETAQPKAFFSSAVEIYPDQAAIWRDLKGHPEEIFGPLKVEAGAVPRLPATPPGSAAKSVPVQVAAYRPNAVRLVLDAPSAGIVVLKDSFFPGWRAVVNGTPADVVRVDGLVRGVVLPEAGHYEVQLLYTPDSFVQGLWLSGLVALLLLVVVVHAQVARRYQIRSVARRTSDGDPSESLMPGRLAPGRLASPSEPASAPRS